MKLDSKWIAVALVIVSVSLLVLFNQRNLSSNPNPKPNQESSQTVKVLKQTANIPAAASTLEKNSIDSNQSRSAGAPSVIAQKTLFPDKAAAQSGQKKQQIPLGQILGEGETRFTHFKIGNRNVKDIYAGEHDDVWFATSGGVIRYDIKQDDYRVFDNKIDGILSNGVFHVSQINGKIFAGTYGGGLSVYNELTDTWRNYNIPQGLADQFVYDVLEDSSGDIWIATWSGINRIKNGELDNPDSWTLYTVENTDGGIPNPWVYSVKEGVNGDLWFATEAGLARYRQGQWKSWNHDNGLGAEYETVKDAIKFTNDPAKSSKHHARQKAEQGLQKVSVAYNPNYIISLAVEKDGTVWAGTWGGGLAQFDGKQWKNYTTQDGLPANHIFMLYLDDDERLWIGTNHGLALYDKQNDSFSMMTSAQGLFADNVFSMVRTASNNLWIGSYGGVARIMPQK